MPSINWRGTAGQNFTPGRDGHQEIALVSHLMMGTLAGTRIAFSDPAHEASAHFGVGEGEIDQYVEVKNEAWGNGPIRRPNLAAVPWISDLCIGKGINPNKLTVVIEWAGSHKGGYWEPVVWQGKTYQVWRKGTNGVYYKPSALQYETGLWLYRKLIADLDIQRDRAHLCRHSDFDSVIKPFCPGDGFPMWQLLHDLGVKGF